MTDAYFTAVDDDRYLPTDHAEGAWSDQELHAAPVTGLLTHHLLTHSGGRLVDGGTVSRITFELLGQIPREEVQLSSRVIRPGRTIELLECTATIAGRPTITARAWLLADGETTELRGDHFEPMPEPARLGHGRFHDTWPGGFIAGLRAADMLPATPGRGQTWVTTDIPMLSDVPVSPVASFVGLVDTANGSAVRERPADVMFPNVDLTIHFFRSPNGIPVGLDTRVAFGPTGQGLTSSVLHDTDGPVGTVQQSLTVRPLER